MDPSEVLDLLGNENRRKILALLADRPFYVNEITNRIGVAPKAVIGHLNLLEKAGLIESSVDLQRRKYYNITRSMRLEVFVSPYSYSVQVSRSDFEIPSEPTYSLSVAFKNPSQKIQRRRYLKRMSQIPMFASRPVIFLAPPFPATFYPEDSFDIETAESAHLFERREPDEPASNPGAEPEYILNTGKSRPNGNEVNSESDFEKNSLDETLKSRDGFFLSQIHRVQREIDVVLEEQRDLSFRQKELDVKKNRLMNSFIHYATQLSEDNVDLDILFRLLKDGMTAADICHETGYAPAKVVPRLKTFEEKGIIEKYLSNGDFVWRLKDGEDLNFEFEH
ncbi:ArsR family transcriptional regulator [Methanolapillus millepedarum]|uniref:HTH arsR-type domain-containing protein n=1 Tax=Methanolapillus millepedarum TaxID=3028296 RepID=A0AA96ZWG4_9EURY|nr:hypothetical protein MsAc7_15090 [Methanosarcinaceae archaeon Ac7]